jgi:acetate---CoA ligase (ADP-forming)
MTLATFFSPSSIAIVGASNDPTRIGGRPLAALARRWTGGVPGRQLFAVNPARDRIQDRPAYRSLAEIPAAPELTIIAVPAAAVLDAVRDCVAAKCRAAIVFTSGFAESGEEGRSLQERMAGIARDGGLRLLGPNCLGVMVPSSGMFATFSESANFDDHLPGGVAIASQSGAIMSQMLMLARRRGVGLSALASTGNECDIDVAECIEYFAGDPATHVIVAYLESCRDGGRLTKALRAARAAAKPVVVLKVGRTLVGSAATQTHTGALAGEDRIYDAVFRQFGAWRAASFDEAIDVAYVCAEAPAPASNRLGVVTISGGAGALVADDASEQGLDVAPLPQDATDQLQGMLPYATARNPLDTTAQILNDLGLWTRSLGVMAEAGYDAILMYLAYFGQSPRMFGPLLKAMAPLNGPDRPPFVFCSMFDPEAAAAARAAGFLIFEDPSRAVRALAGWATIHRAIRENIDTFEGAPPIATVTLRGNEADIKLALRTPHIGVPKECVTADVATAMSYARNVGFPVVMKVVSPDIAHKTEVGGVVLGVSNEMEVAKAWSDIRNSVAAKVPGARFDGILVARQYTGGLELLLGSLHDPSFGTMILLGAGGILAETVDDITMRRAPLLASDAEEMVASLRIGRLLGGIRGGPPLDRAALCAAIVEFAAIAASVAGAASIEINPLLVLPAGQGCVALDALVVRKIGQGAGFEKETS